MKNKGFWILYILFIILMVADFCIMLLLLLIISSFANANIQIQISTDNITWETCWWCAINETNGGVYIHSLDANTLYYFRAKNETTDWYYVSQRTKEDTESVMASLAIMIFVLVTTGTLFAVGIFGKLSKFEITNLILKRSAIVLGLYLMVLNSAIAASISDFAGLDLTNEMFGYMWMFGTAGYIAIIYLLVRTVLDIISIWRINKRKERGFDED